MKDQLRVGATVAFAALVGATLGIAGWEAVHDDPAPAPAATVANPTAQPAAVTAGAFSPAAIYQRVGKSVVEVRAQTSGDGVQQGGVATGSGFVIDEQGRVVTNHHVVENATEVTVLTSDGKEHAATVVGSDPSTDIALLDVEDDANLTPIELGSAASLSVGDPVVAIGSPFGLQGTVTSGIVSGLDREIQAPDGFAIDGAIQTDAALNSGNSGGPLLDSRGRVVGVNSQIETRSGGNDGVGYAVPVETVRNVVGQLLSGGSVEHGYLGVQLAEPGNEDGVPVAEVVSGGPAADAGLKTGDRILTIDGQSVDAVSDVRSFVGDRKPGEKVELTVKRDGSTTTLTVRLGERPAS
jgi:putative serine protease PepD